MHRYQPAGEQRGRAAPTQLTRWSQSPQATPTRGTPNVQKCQSWCRGQRPPCGPGGLYPLVAAGDRRVGWRAVGNNDTRSSWLGHHGVLSPAPWTADRIAACPTAMASCSDEARTVTSISMTRPLRSADTAESATSGVQRSCSSSASVTALACSKRSPLNGEPPVDQHGDCHYAPPTVTHGCRRNQFSAWRP